MTDYLPRLANLSANKKQLLALYLRESLAEQATAASSSDGSRLVAYIVPDKKAAPPVAELRAYLGEQLPDHMIPSVFVTLDALPLSVNGKIDRRALPAPDGARPDIESTFVAPRSHVEEALAAIWAQLLRIERVGIYDNFFDLGGHSLLATKLIFKISEAFQVEIPLRRLFETPTVAGLTAAIVETQAEKAGTEEVSELLAELATLSDEQVKSLLGEQN
jgi:acyl carrier protein